MDSGKSVPRFEDSEFDWDALRPAASRADRRPTVTNRMAWVVLVLLVFCPLVGFLLAHFLGG